MAFSVSLTTKGDVVTLRIKFEEGITISIKQNFVSYDFRLTTSSPNLIADFKVNGRKAQAFCALQKIKHWKCDQTIWEKMLLLRQLAEKSTNIEGFSSLIE